MIKHCYSLKNKITVAMTTIDSLKNLYSFLRWTTVDDRDIYCLSNSHVWSPTWPRFLPVVACNIFWLMGCEWKWSVYPWLQYLKVKGRRTSCLFPCGILMLQMPSYTYRQKFYQPGFLIYCVKHIYSLANC